MACGLEKKGGSEALPPWYSNRIANQKLNVALT